jgi:hypothetical protein
LKEGYKKGSFPRVFLLKKNRTKNAASHEHEKTPFYLILGEKSHFSGNEFASI